MWTPPPDYKASHIAVTESLTSVDTDTEPETDLKLETTDITALTDSDTISVNLADASDDTLETVESIETAITDSDTVSVNLAVTNPMLATTATADSDTVSINFAETESAAASDTISVNLALTEPPTTAAPPASVSAPVGVPSAASHPLLPPPPKWWKRSPTLNLPPRNLRG